MAFIYGIRGVRTIALVVSLAVQGTLAFAEELVGASVESRVTVAFAVDPAGLAPWVPEGWAPVAFPGGPFAGANLLTVFADQHAQTDAEGVLKQPSSKRFIVFAGLGKQTDGGEVRFFAYRVYSSDMSEDPYGNALQASLSRRAVMSIDESGVRTRSENWSITPSDGSGTLTLTLDFTAGKQNWTQSEANPYSNRIEGFNRIYRSRQLVDLAMSAPMGKPLAGEISYASSISGLGEILDGSEAMIAVLDTPVYQREIYLP